MSEPTPANSASHDNSPSARLTEFMATGWTDTPTPIQAAPVAAWTAARRAALSALFPADVLVIPTGTAKVRSADTDYVFRAGSDYAWLVGDLEPDGVLVMWPVAGGNHRGVAYIPGRSDRTSTAFFTDRKYGELWVGPRLGPDEVAQAFAVEAVPLASLAEALAGLDADAVRVVRGLDPGTDALIEAPPVPEEVEGEPTPLTRDGELDRALAELRLIKDAFEIGQLQEAVDATVTGFTECVRELPSAAGLARGERWLEGTFWRRARLDGNDVGYGSIVACGHHATTLHWTRDDGPVRGGDLMLLDMGVEARTLYTADVTRTLPVSGRFTACQRQVYDAVFRAQEAAIAVVRPGVEFAEVHKTAMTALTRDLIAWGLLDGDVEELVKDGMHRRWTLHGTSHHLGIDVHDCSQAREERYRKGTLEAGMVITVEPGLYFQRNDSLAPTDMRGIGVRIEDDILVTDDGCRNLSAALPRGADEVEAWMATLLP